MVVKAEKTTNVTDCLEFSISWFILPIALTTLIILTYRCLVEKWFFDALPLLVTQLNSVLIWGCLAAYQVGHINSSINENQSLSGNHSSFHNLLISDFFQNLVYLEPLNLFLYAWRFLYQLELEENNSKLGKFYHWFAIISIVFFPLCFYCLVPVVIVESTWQVYYSIQLKVFEAVQYSQITNKI